MLGKLGVILVFYARYHLSHQPLALQSGIMVSRCITLPMRIIPRSETVQFMQPSTMSLLSVYCIDQGGVGLHSAPEPPSPENVLYLNGEDRGIVNNLCFPSTVAPSYAPSGQVLPKP